MESYVVLYVDPFSFQSFLSGEQFNGWTNKGDVETIQIIVPTSAILSYRICVDGIQVTISEKEQWQKKF